MESDTFHRRRVGFIVFQEVTALDFIGPMDAFAAASVSADGGRTPCYELVTLGIDAKRIRSESGVVFQASYTLESAPSLDTVLIPGGRGLREPARSAKLAAWLRGRALSTRRIASVCTGIYGLAASGLLDGRNVTTHWAFAHDVAQRFPTLKVDPNALFLKDGQFYTSAGVTAGIDLSLALIEEDHGPGVALAVARELVVYLKRSGDQAQYSEPLQFQAHASSPFADLAAWIPRNLRQPLAVEKLAKRAHLGARHFSRRFKEVFEMTPAEFVEKQRMSEACRRLILPRTRIEAVADAVGYKSTDAFCRAFERHFGVPPSLYRARFATHRY